MICHLSSSLQIRHYLKYHSESGKNEAHRFLGRSDSNILRQKEAVPFCAGPYATHLAASVSLSPPLLPSSSDMGTQASLTDSGISPAGALVSLHLPLALRDWHPSLWFLVFGVFLFFFGGTKWISEWWDAFAIWLKLWFPIIFTHIEDVCML